MLITNNDGNIFSDTFFKLASDSNNILIASGYFGASQLNDSKQIFIDIARQGGVITLIHGMGMWEGIGKSLQNQIIELNKELNNISPKSGFYFYTKQRFHGKIYYFDNKEKPKCIVGSSNFSKSGLNSNLEANLLKEDKETCLKTLSFLKLLLKQSQKYSDGLLPIKGIAKSNVSTLIQKPDDNYKVPIDIVERAVNFVIPIRFQPKSNLNLTFGLGRKDLKGMYKTRPYYEVEITIPKNLFKSPLTNFVPNQIEPSVFEIFTDNGQYFNANFKRKFSNISKYKPIYETGGDFMSSPREALGKYIKDKLIGSGVLKFGELITDETLQDYGNNTLKIKKLDGNRLYMQF